MGLIFNEKRKDIRSISGSCKAEDGPDPRFASRFVLVVCSLARGAKLAYISLWLYSGWLLNVI